MSFTYWASQHQAKKDRQQSLAYLNLAIELDPTAQAARPRAERLKNKLMLTYQVFWQNRTQTHVRTFVPSGSILKVERFADYLIFGHKLIEYTQTSILM